MKFQLAPYNRDLSNEVILEDLCAVARKLGKDYVTKDEYNEHGRLSASTLQKRFGSWCRAHEHAGLRKIRHFDATAEDCVRDLQDVAAELGKKSLTIKEYQSRGRYSSDLFRRRCGSFKAALERAGLTTSPHFNETLTEEQLFENLERLWEALGRQPTKDDYVKPLSRYSYAPYIRRFGSYRKVLEAFVASFDTETTARPMESPEATIVPSGAVASIRHKTSRNITWRMRFLVMRRDSFKCQLCGASPALKSGTVLVVDHITAWESGGETVMENLQALCEPCNGGKSNLPLIGG